MENNFNLKQFLAEGKLLKEEQNNSLTSINPDFTSDKIVTTSKYADDGGRLKSQFANQAYDFGGAEYPIPNSTVVDIDKPEDDEKFIEWDLNEVGKFPPKKYINLTFALPYIDDSDNLKQTILNSLETGGILILTEQIHWVSDFYNKIKSNFDILEIYDYLSVLNESMEDEDEENFYDDEEEDESEPITLVLKKK